MKLLPDFCIHPTKLSEQIAAHPARRSILFALIATGGILLSQFSFVLGASGWWAPIAVSVIVCTWWARVVEGGSSDVGVFIALWLFSALIARATFDASWDGMWYHKNAVIALADGWNAFYEKHWEGWGQSYPMGHWIWDASFYRLFGYMGSAHATNFLFAFGVVWSLPPLLAQYGINARMSRFLAGVITFNPIVLTQLTTGYVDGTMTIALIVSILLAERAIRNRDALSLWAATLWLAFGSCMKFTGWVYAGTAVITLCIYGAVVIAIAKFAKHKSQIVQGDGSQATWGSLSLRIGFTAGALVLFSNLHPITNNWLTGGHPMWPLFGKSTVTILHQDAPKAFYEKGLLLRPALSVFARSRNDPREMPKVKPPGALEWEEWKWFDQPDVRYGGLGPLFSLALTLAILTIVVTVTYYRSNVGVARGAARSAALAVALIAWGYFCIHPWWARYAGFWWILPVIPILFLWNQRSTTRLTRYALIAILAILVANELGVLNYALRGARHAKNQWRDFRIAVAKAECADGRPVILVGPHEPMNVSYARALNDAGVRAVAERTDLRPPGRQIAEIQNKTTAICRAPSN